MQLNQALLGLLGLTMAPLALAAVAGEPSEIQARDTMCTTADISGQNVSKCKCWPRTKGNTCKKTCTGLCYQVDRTTKDCDVGCKDIQNGPCKGCGIWYHTLCDCLQDVANPNKCVPSFAPSPGGKHPWVHLKTADPKKPREHDLITTTEIIPGILDMTNAPSQFYEDAWIFAQNQWDGGSQALAMNPWRVRTEEQVHIHMCKLNPNIRATLTAETAKSEKHLVKLEKESTLWCYAARKNDKITNFVSVLSEFIEQESKKKGGVCRELVGAGMMQDDNGRTWACATTTWHGPLPYFCEKGH